MAKAPKALKPSKAEKQLRKAKSRNPFTSSSLFQKSEEIIKGSPDAKPFEDMSYVLLLVMLFFIWRLSVAVKAGYEGSIGVWSLFSFGFVAIINVWTFFLVMISARSGGDLQIVKITDSDTLRFTGLSGVFGAWAGVLCKNTMQRNPTTETSNVGTQDLKENSTSTMSAKPTKSLRNPCNLCQSVRAILKRPKTGQQLCKECFFHVFETEIHNTIIDNKLFNRGDRVAIGASGGKDSTVLAYVLKLLNDRYSYGLDLVLLSIDEGITGYRDDSLETVKRNRDQYQIPLLIISYKDLYGWSMDDIVKEIGRKNN
ncbi:nucleotidyltransferase, partial [Entomortierella beljakovae]